MRALLGFLVLSLSLSTSAANSWSVTSDADDGPGTLRAALVEANAVCSGDESCTITFFDHPKILPRTVFLRTPLPVVTACELTIRSVRRPPDLPDFTWASTAAR